MSSIRFIGDVHGKFDNYYDVAKQSQYSVQLGDFGFSRAWNNLHYSDLDPAKHKVLGGNHDDMFVAPKSDYWLGNYGLFNIGCHEVFYIRGGLSIDRAYRVGEWLSLDRAPNAKTWWSAEELDFLQMMEAYNMYKEVKPKILVSHAAPSRICHTIHGHNKTGGLLYNFGFDPYFQENTALLLQKCIDFHAPDIHIFGHLHKRFDQVINDTRFICLPELEYFDYGT